MKHLMIVASLASGCSAAGGAGTVEFVYLEPDVEDEDVEAPHNALLCDHVFTTDPEIAEMTQKAVERWNAAAGCTMSVGENGLFAMVVEDVPDTGEWLAVAEAHFNDERTQQLGFHIEEWFVKDHPGTAVDAITHEIGHLLGASHNDGSGIMGKAEWDVYAGTWAPMALTAEDLASACEFTECLAFNPEL